MAEPADQPRPPETEPQPGRRLRALAGPLILAGLGLAAWQLAYWEPRLLPVRVIEVQGELHHHSSELLSRTIGERLKGGFLTADLRELQQAAEDLAWVGTASIRRVWPDRLQVTVDEHRPVAHWNGSALVTAEGLIFRPQGGPVPAGLPMLEGPDARAAEVAARYLKWRDGLMLAGHLVETLAVDARGAWRVDLVSGARLELGTDQVELRLARFIASATQLEAAGQPQTVDLRYANGFAVRWRHSAAAPAAEPQAAAAKPLVKTTAKAKAKNKSVGGQAAKGASAKTKAAAAKPGAVKDRAPAPGGPAGTQRPAKRG